MILSSEFLSNEAKYKKYVDSHIRAVSTIWQNFEDIIALEITLYRKNKSLTTPMIRRSLEQRIPVHDASKFSDAEFIPYCNKFFGSSSDLNKETIEKEFDKAWIHHYTHNDHHPEFWQYKVGDKVVTIPMKDDAFAEMIIDWAAMSLMRNSSTLDWWKKEGRADKSNYLDESDIKFLDSLLERYDNIFDHTVKHEYAIDFE